MLTGIEKVFFIAVTVIFLVWSYKTFKGMFQLINQGADPIDWKRTFKRLLLGIGILLSQKTLFKSRPLVGFIHALVAWGFTLYMVVNLIDILYGLIPGFQFLPHHWFGHVYRFFVDLFSMFVLVGIVFFLVRRFLLRDPRLDIKSPVLLPDTTRKGIRRDSFIVGAFIFLHVGSRLLGASFAVAQEHPIVSPPAATALAQLWVAWSPEALLFAEHLFWWLSIGLILAFLPYFPYSKHAHLFMGPLNYMVSGQRRPSAVLPTLDLEDETIEQFGAAQLKQLPQKAILDGYACIMCNRCQDACPAYFTEKELSPSALEINKRYSSNALARGKNSPTRLTEWMLTEEAVWSCTTCGFCLEICPVGNEPMVDILHIRQDLVLMESRFPTDAMDIFNKLETYGNPWGLSKQDREKWTEGLEVPRMREKRHAAYLYWVGCAGAYDSLGRKVAKAMVKILNSANIDYAILGLEETCTAEFARRLGNEYLFQMQAQQNLETLEQYQFQTIITPCPHCLTTLKDDYAQLGATYNVVHHSHFIADLLQKGRLPIKAFHEDPVTYHDPCYLGRHQGEYEAPRNILQQLLKDEQTLIEMERHGKNGFCCGAGGGNMWYEINRGKRINVERFEEAIRTGAKTVATACSFCNIMLDDALKVTGKDEEMEVKDLALLVADGLTA